MSNTDAHIAKPLRYVKSLDEPRAAALGCWPSDYCHRDDRRNSPDCDCIGCALTMQRRAKDHAVIRWKKRAQIAAARSVINHHNLDRQTKRARRSFLKAMETLR